MVKARIRILKKDSDIADDIIENHESKNFKINSIQDTSVGSIYEVESSRKEISNLKVKLKSRNISFSIS